MSSNVDDDRLSSLPEDIVSHILSLMPTKFAVRTSILSKRWRYSWMFVTNIDFDDTCDDPPLRATDTLTLTSFVYRVLSHCKTSQLKLCRFNFSKYPVRKSNVSSWIDKAISFNVRELDLHVIRLRLPSSFFTCKTLTKLRLQLMCDAVDKHWPFYVNLPCLNTLDIVVDSFVNAFKLIRGCPLLESLYLEVLCRDDKEEDYIFNIPTLKRLKLTLPCQATVINKVVLHVPNLESIFVGGVLNSKFVVEDVSSLTEASVSFRKIPYDIQWVELLKGLSGVKSLSIQNIPSAFRPLIFPNIKHLELKSIWCSEKILPFLESCPGLKHLHIVKPGDGKSHWIKPELVPTCMRTSLTTIKFSLFKGETWEMQLLEYMLRNAEVLKMVTVTSRNLGERKEKWLCEQLSKISLASRCCEVRFRGNWSSSTISLSTDFVK